MYYTSFLGIKCLYLANRPNWKDILNIDKNKRLEAHGCKVGSAEQFLQLSDEEKVVLNEIIPKKSSTKVTDKKNE